MNDLDKIKDLLGSEDPINRELGIVIALSQGMSLDELVDKCYNEKWFMHEKTEYVSERLFDYSLGNYKIYGYSNYADLRIVGYTHDSNILKHSSFIDCFKKLIELLLFDYYPELLNKINK